MGPRLTVDLDALAANLRAVRQAADGARAAGVVKADAYGLGMSPVALRLHTEGVRDFFVARVDSGRDLRVLLGGRPADIFILDGVTVETAPLARAHRLTPVLNDQPQVAAWFAGGSAPAALHIDTGMNRLGFRPEAAAALTSDSAIQGAFTLVMSHLSCGSEADHPMNARQLEAFRAVRGLFPHARASLANSGGAFGGAAYAFDLLRPGVSLYGGGPFETPDPRIAPVATFTAPVLQVRDVPAGESVGYAAGYVAPTPRRVAILGVGYADGLPRSASPAGAVWLAGGRRLVLGRVSMDLTAVDITKAPDVHPGDQAELFGPNLPLDEAATAAGTIAYELLTRVSPRVERVYLGAGS